MEIIELLKKTAAILEKLGIEYCVSGGFAVSVWGRPRSTLDLDIVIQLEAQKIPLFLKWLRSLSKAGYIDEAAVARAIDKGGEFNFIHPESGIKVDFWTIKKSDKIGEQELRRRISEKIDGQKVYFISPEDLILSKMRWYKKSQSMRHLEDIEPILKISKVDLKYLKVQALRQNTLEILRGLIEK